MKLLVNISRFIVGVLFIFSGLIKANDPHGLAYKMQEFFEVWSANASLTSFMQWLSNYALPFSIIMITLEMAYEVTAHAISVVVAPMLPLISLSDTLTMDVSINCSSAAEIAVITRMARSAPTG